MKTKIKTITVNGVEYIEKNRIKAKTITDNYVIVRTRFAGVYAGELIERKGDEVKLKNARRLCYWDVAASLSQLAMEGVSKPENCKFLCEVVEITLFGVIEIISCTQKAIDSIKGVAIWEK